MMALLGAHIIAGFTHKHPRKTAAGGASSARPTNRAIERRSCVGKVATRIGHRGLYVLGKRIEDCALNGLR